jgi:hypothetical protein
MNAPTTRKPVVSTDVFGDTITLNFLTGHELSIDINTLSPEIQKQAMLHGLKQKLVDAAAIARNTETGDSATAVDKYNAVKTVYDRITMPNGTWNAIREGVEKAQGGVFMRAVMELTGKTKAQLDAMLEKLSKEQIAALKKNDKIVDIMQRIEREALANKGDKSDDLLNMLMTAGEEGAAEEEHSNEAVDPAAEALAAKPKGKKGGK